MACSAPGPPVGAVDALEAEAEAGVHEFEQAEIDRRILLGAVELLEEFARRPSAR